MWTAIDYLGESGIGRFYYKGESEGEHYHRNQFPWHGAYCGDIDLTGLRKPISYYREMLFFPERNKLFLSVKEPSGYYGEIKETQWSVWPTGELELARTRGKEYRRGDLLPLPIRTFVLERQTHR